MNVSLKYLTDKVFAIIPLIEDNTECDNLARYINTIIIEANGVQVRYKKLYKSKNFQSVINTLYYLYDNVNSMDFATYRREVLKICNILNKLAVSK